MNTCQEKKIYELAFKIETLYEDNSIPEREFESLRQEIFSQNLDFIHSVKEFSNKKEFFCFVFISFRASTYYFNKKYWSESKTLSQQMVELSEDYSELYNLNLDSQDFYQYGLLWLSFSLMELNKFKEAKKYLKELKEIGFKIEYAKRSIHQCDLALAFESLTTISYLSLLLFIPGSLYMLAGKQIPLWAAYCTKIQIFICVLVSLLYIYAHLYDKKTKNTTSLSISPF